MVSRLRHVGVAAALCAAWGWASAGAAYDGFLTRDGVRLYPLGFYELPDGDDALRAMADAGVNLVHCRNRADLDRVQAVGMQGVCPLPLQEGATDALKDLVRSVVDHPALALWEGPDEIVWNYTAFSGLYKTMGVHKEQGEWWKQTPEALAYAGQLSSTVIPRMREAVAMIRAADSRNRPVWVNEAVKSDMAYVRQYLEFVDITGCDIYPVKQHERPIARMGAATDRWRRIGAGKPVYMVLQAFSWHELGENPAYNAPAYPAFAESRFMAYNCLQHGARGLLYWGSRFTHHEAFRSSIYAVTRELAMLQPFLVAPDEPGVTLDVIELAYEQASPHVGATVRRSGDDWMILLVNEDDEPRMAVSLGGLDALKGRVLHRLYDDETLTMTHGRLDVRLMPREVRVYATDRAFETSNLAGRDFAG